MEKIDIRKLLIAARGSTTLSVLAGRTGIPVPNLSRYFAGKKDLQGEGLGRLMGALEVQLVVKKRKAE